MYINRNPRYELISSHNPMLTKVMISSTYEAQYPKTAAQLLLMNLVHHNLDCPHRLNNPAPENLRFRVCYGNFIY